MEVCACKSYTQLKQTAMIEASLGSNKQTQTVGEIADQVNMSATKSNDSS